jgi:hypothetical protein
VAENVGLTISRCGRLAIPALLFAVSFYLATPHLADEFWYDEAYTLIHFATGDLLTPFTDYSAPNNHILFSMMLGLWRGFLGIETLSVFGLRLLPCLMFTVATLVVWLVFEKISAKSGALAALIFATSHVALNFSCQLRGYGPSWLPVGVALLGLVLHLDNPRIWTALLYALASAVAVGIVPTNLLVCGVLALWAVLDSIPQKPWRNGKLALRLLWICATPFAGLLFYVCVFPELLEHGRKNWNADATVLGVWGEWLWFTLKDLWLLAPLLVAGVGSLLIQVMKKTEVALGARRQLCLIVACLVLPPVFLLMPHNVPYSRTLTPLLPLWLGCLALPVAAAVKALRESLPRVGAAISVLLLGFLILSGVKREAEGAGYGQRYGREDKPFTLYDMYCHHGFHPLKTMEQLGELAGKKKITAFTDTSDLFALIFARSITQKFEAPFMYYRSEKIDAEDMRRHLVGRTPIFISCSLTRAEEMVSFLREKIPDTIPAGLEVREICNAGFFKIYCLASTGKDEADAGFSPTETRGE